MVIDTEQALELAEQWNGGQWSALYSLVSTGAFHHALSAYLEEIEECKRESADCVEAAVELEELAAWIEASFDGPRDQVHEE